MRWWHRGALPEEEADALASKLERLARAAPAPRYPDAARLRMLEALEDSTPAPAGVGLLGMAAIVVALALMVGASGLYIGSLIESSRDLADPSARPSEASEPPGPAATPDASLEIPTASGPPTADDAAERATPSPSPTPDPVDGQDVGDDGPPPFVSPGGPPSQMPGPPSFGAP